MACGAPLEVAVAEPLARAALASALCPGCTDQQFLDGGGAILRLRQEPEGALFPLGRVTITGGAVVALAGAGEHAAIYPARHARGDWGENGHCDEIQLRSMSSGADGRLVIGMHLGSPAKLVQEPLPSCA